MSDRLIAPGCRSCGGDGSDPPGACLSCRGSGRYRAYTGVGSRGTPPAIQAAMREIARCLSIHGFTLRSGGARGADEAFEAGANDVEGPKEIYLPPLPWREVDLGSNPRGLVLGATREADAIAAEIHPNWGALSGVAQRLHSRNVHQVLGKDLDSPSMFLVCWTEGGAVEGGTRTAIVLAKQRGVPCFNLGSHAWTLKEIVKVVKRRRAK